MFCGIVEKIANLCMLNYGYNDENLNGSCESSNNREMLDKRKECATQTDECSWIGKGAAYGDDQKFGYKFYQFDKSPHREKKSFNTSSTFQSSIQTFVFFVMNKENPSLPNTILQPAKKQTEMIEDITSIDVPLVDQSLLTNDFILEQPAAVESSPDFNKFSFVKVNIANEYEKHFYQQDHSNLVCMDELLGPVVLSLKNEEDGIKKYTMKCILRLSSGSRFTIIDYSSIAHKESIYIYRRIIRQLDPRLYRNVLQPVSLMNCLNAPNQILEFDNKMEINTFKFGILYQKSGQTTEEAILGNRGHSERFEQFLDMIADRVQLKDFDRYIGGLDKCGECNSESYYTTFKGKEIMFHISTMIPYRPGDRQQLERKRHIGNDIVAIVYQDCNDTSFCPEMFQSKFSHCLIVVRPVNTSTGFAYQMSVLRRNDVPEFPPKIPIKCIAHGKQFRGLQTTARRCLLESLVVKLRPDLYLSSSTPAATSMSLGSLSSTKSMQAPHAPSRNSVIYSMKKVLLTRKMKQKLFEQQNQAERAKSLPSESEPKLPELRKEYIDENEEYEDYRRMRNMSDSHPTNKVAMRPYSSYAAHWVSQDSLDYGNQEKTQVSPDQETLVECSGQEDQTEKKVVSIQAKSKVHTFENTNPKQDEQVQVRRRFKSLTSFHVCKQQEEVHLLPKERNLSMDVLPSIKCSEL